MLVKSLELLISGGKTEGLREKLDTLYALGRLTKEQYEALVKKLEDAHV